MVLKVSTTSPSPIRPLYLSKRNNETEDELVPNCRESDPEFVCKENDKKKIIIRKKVINPSYWAYEFQ